LNFDSSLIRGHGIEINHLLRFLHTQKSHVVEIPRQIPGNSARYCTKQLDAETLLADTDYLPHFIAICLRQRAGYLIARVHSDSMQASRSSDHLLKGLLKFVSYLSTKSLPAPILESYLAAQCGDTMSEVDSKSVYFQ
jgi:hypothetical protein